MSKDKWDIRHTPYVLRVVAPTSSDINYPIPTLWIDTVADAVYTLLDVTAGVATWLQTGSGVGGAGEWESVSSSSNSTVLDLSGSNNNFNTTLTEDTTLTVTNLPASGTVSKVFCLMTQSAAVSYAVTFGSEFDFGDIGAPDLSLFGAVVLLEMQLSDDGSIWYVTYPFKSEVNPIYDKFNFFDKSDPIILTGNDKIASMTPIGTDWISMRGTQGKQAGAWQFEITPTVFSGVMALQLGLATRNRGLDETSASLTVWTFRGQSGSPNIGHDTFIIPWGDEYGLNSVVSVLVNFNIGNGMMWWGIDGVIQEVASQTDPENGLNPAWSDLRTANPGEDVFIYAQAIVAGTRVIGLNSGPNLAFPHTGFNRGWYELQG